jgi:hypothetical protein
MLPLLSIIVRAASQKIINIMVDNATPCLSPLSLCQFSLHPLPSSIFAPDPSSVCCSSFDYFSVIFIIFKLCIIVFRFTLSNICKVYKHCMQLDIKFIRFFIYFSNHTYIMSIVHLSVRKPIL